MKEELLACPFCGGNWKISQEPHDNGYVAGMWYAYHVGTLNGIERCRISVGGHFHTRQQAIDMINTRTALDAVGDVASAVAAERERCAKVDDVEQRICAEIKQIMQTYREQEAQGCVDTPGGLEHMGDVWKLLAEWDDQLRAAAIRNPAPALTARPAASQAGVVVPREPTDEMLAAAGYGDATEEGKDYIKMRYRLMIAAAHPQGGDTK